MTSHLLEDHQISLIYLLDDVEKKTASARMLADVFSGANFPRDEARRLSGLLNGASVWLEPTAEEHGATDIASYQVSPDLAEPVREFLSGDRPGLLNRAILAPTTSHLLSFGVFPEGTQSDQLEKNICLEFSPRACERLTEKGLEVRPLWINPVQIERLDFSTGATIVVVSTTISRLKDPTGASQVNHRQLSLYELQEAVHALSRFNKCRWYSRETGKPLMKDHFSFGQLIHRLVRDNVPNTSYFSRLPTLTFAKLKDTFSTEVLEREAAHLARRYTSDYPFAYESSEVIFIRDFVNSRAAITSEGFATVHCSLEDRPETEFSKNWKSGSLASVYLPIYIVLLHENWFLSDRRKTVVAARDGEEQLKMMERVVNDTALFQLFFQFSSFSLISMHQAVADAFRKVLRLDEKFARLQSTAQRVSERLEAAYAEQALEEAEKRERNFSWVARIGTASLAGLTAYTIFKDLVLLLAISGKSLGHYHNVSDTAVNLWSGWIAFGLSAIVCGITYFVVSKMTRPTTGRRNTRTVLLNLLAAHQRRGGR